MTMADLICDVCNRPDHKAIGVACTSIPFSCAFCNECAEKGADPVFVFEHWFDVIGAPENHACPDFSCTFFEGQYITYRQWYAIRDKQQDGHVMLWHYSKMPDVEDEEYVEGS